MISNELHVRVVADIGTFEGNLNRAGDAVDDFGRSVDQSAEKTRGAADADRELGQAAAAAAVDTKLLGGALVTVGGSITTVGAAALKTGVAYNTLQQQSRAALTTLLGSAEAANAQMDKLDEWAKNSPFAKQVFIQAQQQLLGFGMAAENVLPTLDAVQNAVAATGGSNQDIAEIVNSLAKVQGTGQLTARTFQELGTRGIDAAKLIGDAMGMTANEVRASVTAGTLDAGKALEALTEGMQMRFGGAAENVKNTALGAFDRVKAAWRDLSSELAEPLVSRYGGGMLVDLLNVAADFMRAFQALPEPIKVTTAAIVFLGGAAMLAGGTFLLLRPKILAVRAELDKLNLSSRLSADGLRSLDRAALLRNVMRGAALLGGLALASSDAAESFALATTAGYTLVGFATGGPIGAAIGAAVGLFSDLSRATGDSTAQLKAFSDSISASDLSASAAGLRELQKAADESFESMLRSQEGVGAALRYMFSTENLRNVHSLATEGKAAWEVMADGADAAGYEVAKFQGALQQLERETVGSAEAQKRYAEGFREMFDPRAAQQFADQVGPILEDIGLSLDDVLAEGPDGRNWDRAQDAIRAYADALASGEMATSAVGDALAGLGDELMSTTDSAKALDEALKGVFEPQMDYDTAVGKWHESLRDLSSELQSAAGNLDLTTEAGFANVSAIQDHVSATREMMVSAAGAGESAENLARMLRDGRQSILDTATAAGFSAEQVGALLDTYGMTPELVQTVIEQVGAEEARREADGVIAKMGEVDSTSANPLILPPDTGPAKQSAGEVVAEMMRVDRTTATPTVSTSGFSSALGQLGEIGSRLATIAATRVSARVNVPGPQMAYGAYMSTSRAGSILPRYAQGAYRTPAHIVRAGVPRAMYGEPETQGESYIPHAMDRRGRATAILSKTAEKFGYNLAPVGREAASDGRVIIVRDQAAPLVGSLALTAGSRDDVPDLLGEMDYELRRLQRGGGR